MDIVCTRQRGEKVVIPEGKDGLYSQCWYAIGLSDEVPVGEVKRFDFLDGHVAAYRLQDGSLTVTSPFCRHQGADLTAGGVVINNSIRCPFHGWRYDAEGKCKSKQALVDRTGETPALFKFPSCEYAGVIWIFNGENPLYDPPTMGIDDTRLDVRYFVFDSTHKLPPALVQCNFFDYQHTKFVHHWDVPKIPDVYFHQYEAGAEPHEINEPDNQDEDPQSVSFKCHGLSCTTFEVVRTLPNGATLRTVELSAMLPVKSGVKHIDVLAVEKDNSRSEAETQAILDRLLEHKKRTTEEDRQIFENISHRYDFFTMQDDYVLQYLEFVKNFPRAHPSADFIC